MHWLMAVSRAKVISRVIDWIAEQTSKTFRITRRMTVVVQDNGSLHTSHLTRHSGNEGEDVLFRDKDKDVLNGGGSSDILNGSDDGDALYAHILHQAQISTGRTF